MPPGASPRADTALLNAFHGKEGLARISNSLVDRAAADPRIAEIFKSQDLVRLKRTLAEQFCYLLNGGCDYSGREMKAAHKDRLAFSRRGIGHAVMLPGQDGAQRHCLGVGDQRSE